MLFPAYTRREELDGCIANTVLDPYYKYYHLSYVGNTVEVEKNFWSKIQLVSLNTENKICGYFEAKVGRPENCVDGVNIINFDKENPRLFATDLTKFFKYLLLEYKTKKINFSVAVGNPVEKQYDRLVESLGGRIVGIKKHDCLVNNKYYDMKLYEIINGYWKCNRCIYTTRKDEGLRCKKCDFGRLSYDSPFN